MINIDLASITEDDYFYRYDLINYYIMLYGYKSYLEIGACYCGCFNKVKCQKKVSVDPRDDNPKLTFNLTSDQFFEQNKDTFDIIFIDGSHLSDQVIIDIENSLKILNDRGTIVMHDCLPYYEEAQLRIPPEGQYHWNGDVWKAFAHYRQFPNLDMHTVVCDFGLGVIKKGQQEPYILPEELDYDYFRSNNLVMMNMYKVLKALELAKQKYNQGL